MIIGFWRFLWKFLSKWEMAPFCSKVDLLVSRKVIVLFHFLKIFWHQLTFIKEKLDYTNNGFSKEALVELYLYKAFAINIVSLIGSFWNKQPIREDKRSKLMKGSHWNLIPSLKTVFWLWMVKKSTKRYIFLLRSKSCCIFFCQIGTRKVVYNP